jgi:murein tripeptide amidase MpaA
MKIPTVVAALGITSTVSACLLESERTPGSGARRSRRSLASRQSDAGFPIGQGDRFSDGSFPVGLGVNDRNLESILSIDEVPSALQALKTEYPDQVELFTPPFKTHEGRELPGAVIGDNPRVFIMSGIHARERGGPDNVIYFVADLLAAKKAGTGIAYADKSYTAEEVDTALSAGLVIIPATNPDGIAYDQSTNTCWRKNRNPESSSSGDADASDIGVDLNRNFDFLWDYEKFFDPSTSPASTNPSDETFYGTAAASEPETQAVVWALDQHQNISWFMDLHSMASTLLYSWGDDDAGTEDPQQNLDNPEYDGKRGVGGDDVYREYTLPDDMTIEEEGVNAMVDAMKLAGSINYPAETAIQLYATSGASNDYAHARYYGKKACGSSRMFGLTLEFGESSSIGACPFYVTDELYHNNVRQVGAGFMQMALTAAGPAGDPLILEC